MKKLVFLTSLFLSTILISEEKYTPEEHPTITAPSGPQRYSQEGADGSYDEQTKELSESRMDYIKQQVTEGEMLNSHYIKAFEDAKTKWTIYGSADGALGYNSNINLSPHNGPLKPITDGTYDLFALLGVDKVIGDKAYYEAEVLGSLHYYFWRNDLNYRYAEIMTKMSHLWSDSWITGLGLSGRRQFQPKLLDLEERLVSQDFTYWGYKLNPFVTYFFWKYFVADLDLVFDRKKYHFVQGREPYDNYQYDVNIKVALDCQKIHMEGGFDWMLIHYSTLPPFNRLGTALIKPNKRQYYQMSLGGTGTCEFTYILLSMGGNIEVRIDDYQGYENFIQEQTVANLTYIPLKDYSLQFTLSGMYQHRNYKYRRSVSQTNKLVVYDTFNVSGDYMIELNKHWHLHGVVEFEQRATNNDKSNHDRFYKQWNFSAGVNAKF